MSTSQHRVIVEVGPCEHCSVQVRRVHHRDFPELQAECGSVNEAVAHLAGMLATHREGASSNWHRETVDHAIDDVNAYLKSLVGDDPEGGEHCRCGARSAAQLEPSIPRRGPSA
jgi:hypothetical protein